jgi:hypothetical protein
MNNDFHVSGTWLEKACSTAPLNAESYFYMGKAYLGGNDSINALTAFRAARDLDYNPFRAIGDFNSALREIAGQHPGVTLIDIENLMNNYAAGGIPGFDIFLDYVHPTKKGNMLIAHEISKNLVSKKIIGQEPVGKTLTLTDVRALLETDYNENRDYNLQVTKFSLFCLTHQYQTAIAQGNWLAKNLPKSVFQSEQKSRIRNMIFEAIEAFGDFEKAEKESFSGDNFLSQGTPAKQKLDAFYAKYFPYGTF